MNRKLLNLIHTKRGLALISVLAMVTLATVIVLALFSISDAEFKSSKVYAGGNSARQLGDAAVNTVISQIRSATYDENNPAVPRVWASQPGAIRVYSGNGTFAKGYKLYSDSAMVVNGGGSGGEAQMNSDVPSADWANHPDQYADLNEPVVRVDGAQTRLFFPIIDPRAAVDDVATNEVESVEGFSYDTKSPVSGGGGDIAGIVAPAGMRGSVNNLRLPMPVEWLYILKDGTIGTVDAAGNWVGGAGMTPPTVENPMVGRVAFWTDDECAKVNINTASEPGYWAVPSYYHDRDKSWADAPPVINEYQRFPGHPATVALSTILYPSADPAKPRILDSFGKTGSELSQVLEIKEKIYQIMPKLNGGGSKDGTLVFEEDDVIKTESTKISIAESKRERLYASLDELIFSEKVQTGSGGVKVRTENDFSVTGGTPLLSPVSMERKRFFMTAQSRAPETNMFGLPRVAMWPIPEKQLGDKYRTGFDTMIATAATLSSNPDSQNTYYFSRWKSDSTRADIGLDSGGRQGLLRNAKLMTYLDSFMDQPMPGVNTTGTFRKKFQGTGGYDDSRQILVEIFDYIRSTNLYDSFLAPEFKQDKTDSPMNYREGSSATANRALEQVSIHKTAPKEGEYYTYTEPRFKVMKTDWRGQEGTTKIEIKDEIVAAGSYPGHGQVTPIIWIAPDGKEYRGFGRFPTISEVSLHFICTADGKPDDGSFLMGTVKSGGKTAEWIDPNQINTRVGGRVTIGGKDARRYWYSNFPPFPTKQNFLDWGCTFGSTRDPKHAINHPAADPMNWNATLDTATPLKENEKRIQLAIQLELFVPSVGWTKYSPKWSLALDGKFLAGIKVRDAGGRLTSVFSTTSDRYLKSNQEFAGGVSGLGDNYGIYPIGSTASPRACTAGRHCGPVGNLPKDPSYDSDATSDQYAGLYNYDFISNPVTISRPVDATGTDLGTLTFEVTEPLKIRIHADHLPKNENTAVQTLEIKFPSGETTTPAPQLVVYGTEKRQWESGGNLFTHEAVQACHWWAFHRGGALDRWQGSYVTASDVNQNAVSKKTSGNQAPGRFQDPGGNSNPPFAGGSIPANGIVYGYDPGNKGVQHSKDIYTKDKGTNPTTLGKYEYYGSDTIRSMIPKYGDYRLIAAKKTVPADMWEKHPLWDSQDSFFAHNLCSYFSNTETGFHLGGGTSDTANALRRLVKNQEYGKRTNGTGNAYVPDMPHSDKAMQVANRYGDFDTGPGNCRDGSYINKPDEGNLSIINLILTGAHRRLRNAYFHDSYLQLPTREAFYTPNRMISSPGMFGSLPAGVYGGGRDKSSYGEGGVHGDPWRTLLFRADAMTGQDAAASRAHPGAGFGNGAVAPADHYFMDLFWMPIIEPYAITDNWSSAGKINMNFQIQPFSYIKRATALYAAMKGELITAVPKEDAGTSAGTASSYKEYKSQSQWPEQFFNDATDKKYWHRYIDLATTTNLMASRMDMSAGVPAQSQGLFRTASQICEVHLVPQIITGAKYNPSSGITASNATAQMGKFWKDHAVTGENVRERPYANLYQKLTTRSNVFRIHYRAQALKKARSLAPTQVVTDPSAGTSTDTILAEYRASALIERYLNVGEANLPDYGSSKNPMSFGSLDQFYRYRVLETKQFAP